MRKIFYLFSLCLSFAAGTASAENLSLTDDSALTGEIIKTDDNGLLLRLAGDVYATTNVAWSRLSQDSLKLLAGNQKLRNYVEPFIEPTRSARPHKAAIQINPVKRLELPANPSIFGGLAHSSLGIFIFLLLYTANIYAGFEVAVLRGRPKAQVMGVAAVLPVVGPIIFLAMPVKIETPAETEAPAEAEAPTRLRTASMIAEAEAPQSSWQEEEAKKSEPQIFSRGKFTFNKRFIETKFAAFIGGAQGEEAKRFTMEVVTSKARLAVVRINQVAVDSVVLDAVQHGAVTVALADIQEIRLNPKAA